MKNHLPNNAWMDVRRFKLFVLISLLCLVFGSGCSLDRPPIVTPTEGNTPGTASPSSETRKSGITNSILTVFAAASLTGAFQEIGLAFEATHPGVQVSFNFAGSQILRTQLEQGAPADVYASADQKNMHQIVVEKLVVMDAVHDFATNSLIVILPAGNPGHITNLLDLAKPGVKLVLADTSVPAGNYARLVLEKMSQDAQYGASFSVNVINNVVSNETDVKQVVAKVELGEADAGIVYTSDAVSAPELITLTIPSKFNVLASYPIAVLANAPQPILATGFVNYVTSPAGQSILAKWGFTPLAP